MYSLGPMKVFVQDPFGLARTAIEAAGTNELIVYPQVEDLQSFGLTAQGVGAGESAVRHLYRSAAEFYTMREYVSGDDLRRIHWPSVARTNRLMIRQDESTRRATAVLFLDNRGATLGNTGSPGFERAISAAATVGRAMIRAGFALELATAEAAARGVGEERLLDTLAASEPGPQAHHGRGPHHPSANGDHRRHAGRGLRATLRRRAADAHPAGGRVWTADRRARVPRPPVVPHHPGRGGPRGPGLGGPGLAAAGGMGRHLLQPDGKLAEAWRSQRKPERRLPAAASSS